MVVMVDEVDILYFVAIATSGHYYTSSTKNTSLLPMAARVDHHALLVRTAKIESSKFLAVP
jgi:hypothetical protein